MTEIFDRYIVTQSSIKFLNSSTWIEIPLKRRRKFYFMKLNTIILAQKWFTLMLNRDFLIGVAADTVVCKKPPEAGWIGRQYQPGWTRNKNVLVFVGPQYSTSWHWNRTFRCVDVFMNFIHFLPSRVNRIKLNEE